MAEKYDYKEKLKELKERMGGVDPEFRALNTHRNKLMREVKKAIKEGLNTVPAIAEKLNAPTHEVFWAINALRRYDDVVIVDKRSEYPVYGIKEKAKVGEK